MPSTDTIRVHVPLSLRKRGGRPRILPPKEIETGLPPRNRSGRRAIDPADSRLLIFAGFFWGIIYLTPALVRQIIPLSTRNLQP
jgi:hypothetical protein